MKAFLSFQGFSRMLDIPSPMPQILIPIMEVIDLYVHLPDEEINMPVLTFYRDGELTGGDELILRYRWDGVLPRGKNGS